MAKLEVLSKVDPARIRANPKDAVPEAMEALAAAAREVNEESVTNQQLVAKLAKDVEGVLSAIEAVKAEQKELVREVPGPDAGEVKLQKLSRGNLRLAATQEEASDKEIGSAFASLSREQYSLLVQKPETLGIEDAGTAKALKRLRALHDATVLWALRLSGNPAYPNFRGWESLPWAEEYKKLSRKFTGALSDATVGEGKEFVPVNILSGQIYDLIELDLELMRFIDSFPMPGPTVKKGVKGGRSTSYYTLENIADAGTTSGAVYTASSPATTDATFTAKKQTALAYDSEEWELDAIVSGPQYILGELAFALADGCENACVNGQLAAAMDLPAPNATGDARDVRTMVNGIRKLFAQTGATARDLSAGVTGEELAAIWASQGKYGKVQEGLWLTGVSGLARMMLAKASDGTPLFMSAAVAGQASAAVTGVLGSVFGRPVIVSRHVPETLNSAGVIPSPAGSASAIYQINRRAVMMGERQGVIASRSEHYRFVQGQLTYKAVRRWDFQPMFAAASNKIIGAGFGVVTY